LREGCSDVSEEGRPSWDILMEEITASKGTIASCRMFERDEGDKELMSQRIRSHERQSPYFRVARAPHKVLSCIPPLSCASALLDGQISTVCGPREKKGGKKQSTPKSIHPGRQPASFPAVYILAILLWGKISPIIPESDCFVLTSTVFMHLQY
jgi:hypothetical protein